LLILGKGDRRIKKEGEMRPFVLDLVLLGVLITGLGLVADAEAAFRITKRRMPVLSESIEVPLGRRVRVPDSIETDGARTHLAISAEVPGRTRFSWEAVERLQRGSLHRALMDSRVEDLVLVAGSSPDGRLFDEDGVEFPKTFFDPVSPNLRTLSIFTCFAEQVMSRYSLRKALDSGLSYHPERALMVSDAFCGEEDPGEPVFPGAGRLRAFLRQVEEGIRSLRNREWWQDEPVRSDPGRSLCSLNVRFPEVNPLRIDFFLNERFIGTAEEKSGGPRHISYPCSFLVPGRNLIRGEEFPKNRAAGNSRIGVEFEPLIPGASVRGTPRWDGFEFTFEFGDFGGRWFPLMEF